MKKVLLIVFTVALVSGLALAQYTGNAVGNLNYAAQYDNMGAHENGGRGCAGCHAPHSGGRGSGGNTITTGTNGGTQEDGNGGLWGTDVTAIFTSFSAAPVQFGNGAHVGVLTVAATDNNWSSTLYKDVLTCLSCHDGVVSRGAMMSGVAYEQAFGLLNGATYMAANRNGALTTSPYGPNPIPTLLGSDSGYSTAGYYNDHPLGQTANLGAVLGSIYTNAAYGLTLGVASNKLTITLGANTTPYGAFVQGYGDYALSKTVYNPNAPTQDGFFVVCTTCHNQHSMSVYSGTIANVPNSKARTIFFVAAPYNPGAAYDPTHVPSTERFCLTCHFSQSAEYYGALNVGTAF
jgi:cytochrome c553